MQDSTYGKVHLVSFADGAFVNRKSSFIEEAKDSGLFNSITVFDLSTLDQNYSKLHGEFMSSNNKGFGYWIWKPQVVLQLARDLSSEDLIVYMDVGFEINPTANSRFNDYLQLTLEHESKMLSFDNTHTEQRWNKMDLPIYLGLERNSIHLKTSQLGAGCFFLKNTIRNRELLEYWKQVATAENYHYSDDTESVTQNHDSFIEHRHDASIFSLIRKMNGTQITHYEVQKYSHFDDNKLELPFWASRKGRC